MRTRSWAAAATLLLGAATCGAQDAPPRPPLAIERSIPLPGVVEGLVDHLATDGRLLAVAATASRSVEVVDLEKGAVVRRLTGLASPLGVAFHGGRLAVACGEDFHVRWFDPATGAPSGALEVDGDADNLRVDAATGRLWVAYGDGELAAVEKGAVVARVRLAGHPEGFALATRGPRAYANVADAAHVAVVDRERAKVVATWPVAPARENYPLALDEARGRLYVGCREPATLVVMDAADGRVVARVPIAGDVDDVALDARSGRVHCSCGEGFVETVVHDGDDRYRTLARVATRAGARTCVLSADGRRLFVALPARDGKPAEVAVLAATE